MLKTLCLLAVATLVLTGATPHAAAPQAAVPAPVPAATAPATTPVTGQAPAPGSNDYIVGPQDVLRILVFDEPTLSNSFRVDADGSFQYPFLDRVPAAGKSLRQIEQFLSTALEAGFVRRAQVTVEVEQFRARSIFVMGEVRQPGKFTMQGQMTVLEGLAAAGSITQNAGSEVMVLRPNAPSSAAPVDASANATVLTVNLAELQLGKLSENLVLQEGDTLFVPKAEKFYMTGQIKSPGAYTWERGLTVLQAMSLAGGLTDKGSNRRIKVIRSVDGEQVERGIDLTEEVQPGDTIVIATRLF
jgi:polysaccharide export outer membrane protein